MTEPDNTPFSINAWQVSPATLRINKGDKTIKLEPKVMQVLVFLAAHPSEVVSRQTLEETIWAGTVVGYDAVTNTVIKLRKAFGDSARQPRFIETIPKKGYRLIADVTIQTSDENSPPAESLSEHSVNGAGAPIETPTAAQMPSKVAPVATLWSKRQKPQWLAAAILTTCVLGAFVLIWLSTSADAPKHTLPLPNKPSIVVLPFLNISNEPGETYFSDGITEDLITDLSAISGLFVIARNSSFRYKGKAIDVSEVAAELGVRFILQGSVRKNNDQVRLNVQLTDSASGANLWAERYDMQLDDVFTIQDEVTHNIVSALSVTLSEAEQGQTGPKNVPDAASYDEFLKGWQYYWRYSRDDFALAEQHFRKALAIDPDNSRAHAGLALIYWEAWRQNWHENLGNVHAGWVRANYELELAMRNPTPLAHSTQSAMLLINRRFDEAIVEAETAIQMNRNHAMGYLALAEALSYAGQPGKAIDNARKGMRLDPNFGAPYLLVIGRAQFDMGLYQEASVSLQRALKFNPVNRSALIVLAASYGHLQQSVEAEIMLAKLQQAHQQEKLRPFTIDWLTNRWPYRQKATRDHLLTGLEKAGAARW